MSERDTILALAKVVIATAWADGEIKNEEVNSLKDLLFELPNAGYEQGIQLNAQDWALLDMYIETPIGADERARLVDELQRSVRTKQDKALVAQALDDMIHIDGRVTTEEETVLAEIKAAMNNSGSGGFLGLGRLVNGAVSRRSEAVANAPNREKFYNDFIQNKVFYVVEQRLRAEGRTLQMPEEDARKLSLAGGLMAIVAGVDREVTPEELASMQNALHELWQLDIERAGIVADIAIQAIPYNYDPYRMLREFTSTSTYDERLKFVDVLFAVADADGHVSHEEVEEIRVLARGMNLSHQEFIAAKIKIPRERRAS